MRDMLLILLYALAFVLFFKNLPSRELTYPTLEKGWKRKIIFKSAKEKSVEGIPQIGKIF